MPLVGQVFFNVKKKKYLKETKTAIPTRMSIKLKKKRKKRYQ
jgi:hypothetical protein